MAGWSSGWVVVAQNGETFNFTHNLETTDLILSVYLADDAAGANSLFIGNNSEKGSSGSIAYDAQVNNLSESSLTVQLGSGGYFNLTTTGNTETGNSQSFVGKYIKVVAISSEPAEPAAKTTNNSSIVFFETPYEIQKPYTSAAWTPVAGQGDWTDSGATTLVVVASTLDFDIGGNSSQTLKTRAADGSAVVTIINHEGTSATRTVTSEQAFIECAPDGSFEYLHSRDSSNASITQFRVIGYMVRDTVVPGTGDLCKILSEDSGYQMFRNGLTMQWMSSPAFITESSQVINFPIQFAAKPFKVVVSPRYPSNDAASTTFFQSTSWNKDGVTIFAQAGAAAFSPVYADIIAIGMAEVTGCPGTSSDPQGTKISHLPSATNLKDDDLFVISKENDNNEDYDASLSVKLSDLSEDIKGRIGPTFGFTFIEPVEIYTHSGYVILPWTTKDLSTHIPKGATGCIINITYAISGPDDGVPAQTLLRSKSGKPQYIAIYAGAWAGGDAVGANSQGLYPINAETRSIDISIPVRSPNSQIVYLVGYF